MSHVAQCKTVLKDVNVIEKAACRLGGTFLKGQKKLRWYGAGFVDDSTGWTEFFAPDEVKRIKAMSSTERRAFITKVMNSPDHVIQFKGASYDVGIYKIHDGTFRARWDEWGQGRLGEVMGPGGGKFAQAYGVEAAKKAAKSRGYTCKETAGKNGSVKLELLVR